MQDPPETEAILRRMVEVRRDLDEGVQEIVESSRDLGEWRHYVRSYPWTCLGIACVIGYVIVPRRRPRVPTGNRTPGNSGPDKLPTSASLPVISGLASALRMFASNWAWRSVLSLAARQANQYLAARSGKSNSEGQR